MVHLKYTSLELFHILFLKRFLLIYLIFRQERKVSSLIFSSFLFVDIMDVTAVTESVKKKLTNSRIKRSCSFTIHCPSKRSTNLDKAIHTRDYFLHQRTFTDVKIQLNNEIIWCEKAFLAAASPILCEQLCQLNSNENFLILEDIDLDEFLSFLEFIYPVFNPRINQNNISSLVKLANRFQFSSKEMKVFLYAIRSRSRCT